MDEIVAATREIDQMDRAIDDYFRKDRAGDKPKRPDYKAFINKIRSQWGSKLNSRLPGEKNTADAILDKLVTYERIWDGQFIRYSTECERERDRQTFLDRASLAVRVISRKTGQKIDSSALDSIGSQYDEIVRGGKKPSVFYNKATNTFTVKEKE